MMLMRIIPLLFTILVINACSYVPKLDEVLPDRRKDYQKSEALPDLEVPPDLTVDAQEDPLNIPDEEVTTLSEYEARKGNRSTANLDASGIDPLAGEQWILVQGSAKEIWPRLKEFWSGQGYSLDLDDPDLGVLETDWLETSNQGISVYRDKFSLFTEAGGSTGTTVIYISNDRQERIASSGESTNWVSIDSDPEYEKQLISDMNIYFYGENAPAGTTSISTGRAAPTSVAAATRPRAEMLDLDKDKIYLSLPDEFARAWELTEQAILRAGMFIESNDQSKGLYNVLYYDQQPEEESLLSKLKFWGDDEEDGKLYQISLTGVGDKTELVVLDEKGQWVAREDASKILTFIQSQYNSVSR
ncbi:MAG TPA: outer membrane protein assembly factor BamC [Gammaproteobacteria bacterium]|nr:outer membrane protein assembly factor BamC [Gammaproteobacteria bacterium]